jgi:Uma2 family endonuclease
MPHQNEERLMTGEEFARYRDFHGELVNGRPVPMPMAGRSHAAYQARVSARRRRTIQIHRAGADPETLGIGDTLRDEEILPGFSLSLSDLFQD